ncbi:MAG: tRNA (adenosine(37)-N6)-threonylcarbamoyltransferase complex ATPase subunit type 1 TsaE [Verrucomicrobia bacterium]|nr:tRNA (adenosine(37)-N6)-threonylcarbamoyltransferase complex ATPase subunit type 1 TsaE [Verrucomicrobiota bacterium]
MIETAQHLARIGDSIQSSSPDDTIAIASNLLTSFPRLQSLALHGNLGAGKTCFVQGLALSLGITETVTSPTFTIMREYVGNRRLIHVDFYRIQSPDELLAIGFEEWFTPDTLVAMEWAERAGDLLPSDTLHLHFSLGDQPDTRNIERT